MKIRFDQSREDRLRIAGAESDLVARWDTVNALALEVLVKAARDAKAGKPVVTDAALSEVLVATAEDATLEPAFRALALTLPGELEIGRELGGDVDPDAIHVARKAVVEAIATVGRDTFAQLAEEMQNTGAFSPDAEGAGRRALRNAALALAAAAEKSPHRASRAYEKADNMTDMLAAMRVLAHQFAGSAETENALADFRQRFADEPLVLDKWFSTLATVPGEATLERVAALMGDEAFDETNPNRVRALIGAFASSNPTGFNRADGAGYAFFADFILTSDKRNATLTARLMTAMRSFEALEPGRRALARKAIKRIASHDDLSRNLRDIVDRMLKS
nr:aminopeptidase N C-terminal domain-containing protein [Marinicella sp. W31]MDC2876585.1 aminopeptidase N C-terminal domain-containing protein [Marinicella sp. W31]